MAGLVAVAPCRARAFPIPPVPLWDLVQQSSVIVVAEVVDLQDIEGKDMFNNVANLSVRETWKGTPPPNLDVRYTGWMMCPAPARYVKGEIVLAFLTRETSTYRTVGLSYGTLYPDVSDLPVFHDLVNSAVRLQATKSGDAARRGWLVQAALRGATRWHGLYELAPAADAARSYYDHRLRRGRKAPALTRAELRSLAQGFVAEPTLGVTFPMMLALLKDVEDRAVTDTAVQIVDLLLFDEAPPRWTVDAIAMTAKRMGKSFMKPPEPKLDRIAMDPLFQRELPRDLAELRARWSEMRKGIETVTELSEPRTRSSRVPGVGDDTPP